VNAGSPSPVAISSTRWPASACASSIKRTSTCWAARSQIAQCCCQPAADTPHSWCWRPCIGGDRTLGCSSWLSLLVHDGHADSINAYLQKPNAGEKKHKKTLTDHLRACLVPPLGLAPKDGNQVGAQDRELTTPEPGKRKKKKKTAHRGSLSLDKGSHHKCSARPA
jgi:hypothetical protein